MAVSLRQEKASANVDRQALEQWRPFLGLFFDSMEQGLRELRSLTESLAHSEDPRSLRLFHMRAHALRGAADTVGLKDVAALLRKLEREVSPRADTTRVFDPTRLHRELDHIWAAYWSAKSALVHALEAEVEDQDPCGGR
ncbi:MAG: Hpt domain-containing protein [candidate division KSB1 bacterium]|nr:Hpt domain-containing protein [candidate division KSB1 bacterium]